MNNQKFLAGVLSIIAFVACSAENVKAQNDQCRDVLLNGTLQYSRIRDNRYFKQIIYSRFMSSSYEQAKTDTAGGFGVPIGEVVLGGDFTREQFNEKKRDLEKENFQSITSNREIDVALTSGDPIIIAAWTDCMRSKGGLSLLFEPTSPTEVFATLEWYSMAAVTETTLDEDVNLPEGSIFSQGAACFKKGRTLKASGKCQAVITLPNALATLAIAVNTPHSSTRAYLPRRIELRKEVKNYPITSANVLYAEAFRTNKKPKDAIKLSDEQIAGGWFLDVSSANLNLETIRALDGNYRKKRQIVLDSYTFEYELEAEGNRNGRGRNSTVVCRLTPSIRLIRERWVPMGSGTSIE
jgi:hypothetical protein